LLIKINIVPILSNVEGDFESFGPGFQEIWIRTEGVEGNVFDEKHALGPHDTHWMAERCGIKLWRNTVMVLLRINVAWELTAVSKFMSRHRNPPS
jgi:hypothetical protein